MPAIAHENKFIGNTNNLNELSDVNVTSPTDKQGLVYDATTGKWVNGDVIDEEAIHWSEATTSVKKNLLENKGTAQTIVGVSFTINDNKSIELNGTATNNNSNFVVNSYTIPAGQYILSKTGTSDVAFQVTDNPVTRELYKATTSNVVMTFAQDTAIKVRVSLVSGKTYNNTTIYPMIRFASIEDDTYEPYIPDNTELMRYTDNGVLGAKNLFQITATTRTQDGVTITVNKDSSGNVLSIVLNGTATRSNQVNLNNTAGLLNTLLQKYGDLIWSGSPSRNDCRMYTHIQNGAYITLTNGEEKILSASNNYDANILIQYDNGVTYNNVTFKPMLRLATDTDDTYVPYAMTNRELTEKYGRIQYLDLANSVVDKTGDFSVEISNVPSGDYIAFLRCQGKTAGVLNSEINSQECGIFNVTSAWEHFTSFVKITVNSNGKVTFHSKSYTTATYGNAKITLLPLG